MLVLVVAVLTVSYASSLKAYFQQHSQIQQLRGQIASSESSIHQLESEKVRWNDPAYVREQARARFGYLMPGESGFEVIGADGKPLEAQATLNDPSDVIKTVPLERLLVETDAPFLAPMPHRGKTNEPAFVVHTARMLAELKGVPENELAQDQEPPASLEVTWIVIPTIVFMFIFVAGAWVYFRMNRVPAKNKKSPRGTRISYLRSSDLNGSPLFPVPSSL